MSRIGGRGCPNCGSHLTNSLGAGGAQWCDACDYRWVAHSPSCRGYVVDVGTPQTEPQILGCPLCGVPDRFARRWPEAYRAMARALDASKRTDVLGE